MSSTNTLYLVINDENVRRVSCHHFSDEAMQALVQWGVTKVPHYLRHLPDRNSRLFPGYDTAIEIMLGGGATLGGSRDDLEGMALMYIKDSRESRVAVTTSEKANEVTEVFRRLGQEVQRVN